MVGKNKTQNGLLNKSSELKDRKSNETYKEKEGEREMSKTLKETLRKRLD